MIVGGNRVSKVSDTGTSHPSFADDFRDQANQANEFTYSPGGFVLTDANKLVPNGNAGLVTTYNYRNQAIKLH